MNYINIDSFSEFDKEIVPIQTKIKSEILEPSLTPQQPDAPDAPDAPQEIEPVAGVEMPANSSQLGQIINDNFVQTPQEQAQTQLQDRLEEISLDTLIPKPNSIANVTNDIVNPEDNLSIFKEDAAKEDAANSGQSSESGSQSGESGSQSGESGSQSGESGSQSKVIKLE